MSVNPENSNNPFDYVGKYHNEVLDAFISELSSDSVSFENPLTFCTWMFKFITDTSLSITAPGIVEPGMVSDTLTPMVLSVNYYEQSLTDVLDVYTLTEEQKLYFTDLNDFIVSAEIESEEQLQDFVNSIIAKENQVSSVFEGNGEYVMQMAYSMLSVAKYSAVYWHDNFSDPDSSWSNLTITFENEEVWDIGESAAAPTHWSEYVAEDAVGALSAVYLSLGAVGPWGALASAAFSTGWSILKDNA
ncbi:MAG: hypothetical protein CL843_18155 [Crocinitomicaceae bacterium]|nr:hypothetical protein [Crocinitomicaceae bacterium]|tara:strand:+ start:242 stop:979 length:738 start_codon:yes stop_codon:yes gene_type:complete